MVNQEFKQGYGKYVMDEFEFEYGRVLENVQVEYSLSGNPKYDDEGNITNAILYCHKYNGNFASFNDLFELTKKGAVFDKNDYFFISITSLGFPESCSPSTTGLKYDFPKYSFKDSVNFKRQFLKEKLGIERLHGILGRGIGGNEALTWACEYQDEMDFIMVYSCFEKTSGYRYVIAKCFDSIIDSTDDFYDGVYSESLTKTMVSINRLLYSNYFSKKVFHSMDNDEIDVLMDDFVDEGLFIDIYDFKFRNDAITEYNIENKLKNIKAKTLIVSSSDEIYHDYELDVKPLKDKIDNCELLLFNPKLDYTGFEDFSVLEDDLSAFMDEFRD